MFKILPCECHKVSASGFVYSCLEQFSQKGVMGIQTRKTDKWRKLNGVVGQFGYMQACLHGRVIRINRLIASAFIENPMAYPESQHINGNRLDNRVKNLKWGTPKHNAADRDAHGMTKRGSKSTNAKLVEREVAVIRKLRTEGRTLQSLADQFRVSKKLILLIVQGKIWTHVK